MKNKVSVLAEALPLEIARVRDEVIPAYVSIGPSGLIAIVFMRDAVSAAEQAVASGDAVSMLRSYAELKGFTT